MKDNNTNIVSGSKKRTSKLAIASFILAIAGSLIFSIIIISLILPGLILLDKIPPLPADFTPVFFIETLLLLMFLISPSLVIAFVLARIAIVSIKRSKERLTGRRLAKISSLLSVIFLVGWFIIFIVIVIVTPQSHPPRDVKIKSDLSNMRAKGEMYAYDNNNTYKGFCDSDEIKILLNELADYLNTFGKKGKTPICNDSDNAWATCSPFLYLEEEKNWCVDSNGNSKAAPTITCDSSWIATKCP